MYMLQFLMNLTELCQVHRLLKLQHAHIPRLLQGIPVQQQNQLSMFLIGTNVEVINALSPQILQKLRAKMCNTPTLA